MEITDEMVSKFCAYIAAFFQNEKIPPHIAIELLEETQDILITEVLKWTLQHAQKGKWN